MQPIQKFSGACLIKVF
jgi:transposase